MRSLLSLPTSPFPDAVLCPAGRTEQEFTIHRNGLLYRFVLRDKVTIEDPYLVLVKATAFAIRHGTGYPGGEPPKELKDALLKTPVRP